MLGALISSVPSALEDAFGLALLNGYKLMLALFVILGFMSFLCVTRLSGLVEVQEGQLRVSRRLLGVGRSRRTILCISTLFGIDAFTSGLVATSLFVLMFYYRFDVGTEVMGPVYTGARLLQVVSYQVAVLLADRFGLLNTMVFTHLPSQLLLIALPFAPNLPLAIVILISRQSLAHMDIPLRQAYVATVVDPEERTTAAGISNFTRNIAQGISPTFTGYALQTMAYSIPFLLAGLLGIVYDLALYASFRGVKPPHEIAGTSPEAS